MDKNVNFTNTDEYIAMFPTEVQEVLEKLRQTIKNAAPQAEETISYQMPAFKLHGSLVYFAAYKKHIGFYPTASGISAFKEHLTNYEVSKGTIKFPINEPLPFDLITTIVKFRVEENLSKKFS
jgi:uncharacterized protein YdhG (YjbR/CyaY superfamily)